MVFLAITREVSYKIVSKFLAIGCAFFDLSGAIVSIIGLFIWSIRFSSTNMVIDYIKLSMVSQSGREEALKNAQLVTVPSCYSTVLQ